jgi:5-methylcytosine-specific restriction enzyme A
MNSTLTDAALDALLSYPCERTTTMAIRATQYRTKPPTTSAPRPSAGARGYGWRWQKFRKAFLAQHPLCVRCDGQGKVVAAEHVHHKDWQGPLGPRGYDEDNLEALCQSCHNQTTARGQR